MNTRQCNFKMASTSSPKIAPAFPVFPPSMAVTARTEKKGYSFWSPFALSLSKGSLILLGLCSSVVYADVPNALRGAAPLNQESKSPSMARVENTDIKRTRNYTDQPPTIPHKIDGYEISLNVNKCMMCHSRERTEEFQAPMVSATHFMDRNGDFLAQISARRYFCTQCHVPQTDARVPVQNTFEDVDTVIAKKKAEMSKKK